ncbi:WXG100 family type VII secretion target [Streptomyces sp. R-07]|uniref:WXG100 family type VII secretion target n=1 Tax=Streptomyces tanashiensis TaxID=67367 RepID=A0ABY6RAR3_9ACTN|nr:MULTISPECIES: WXG100 family type VII secretion target [Streptomyces]MCX4984696.1 WXG100 family type VII secretion target [Streptomyces sp. NBC_00572]UZX26084.1 WXG100 family type VII secretion target [Streptomyces tanashiensis]
MADYIVNDEKTASAAQQTMNEYDIAVAQLNKIKTDLDALTADGYNTPSAQRDFRPFVEEYTSNYGKVTEGLTGISEYIKKYGEGMTQFDSDMGASLRG